VYLADNDARDIANHSVVQTLHFDDDDFLFSRHDCHSLLQEVQRNPLHTTRKVRMKWDTHSEARLALR
jgi:hypothetical protein